MKDEKLLAGLAGAARRDPERARPERWEKLASGEATDDEKRALEALGEEWDEPEAVAALAPVDASFASKIAERVEAERRAKEAPTAAVVPIASRSRARRTVAIVAVIALAAGAAFVFGRPRGPTDAPLPEYAMLAQGGLRGARGAPSAPASAAPGTPLQLGPDSVLRITLRPERDVNGATDMRAALIDGTRVRAWAPPFALAPSGLVSIVGRAQSLIDGGNGPREIVIAVGRPSSLPETPEALVAARSDEHVRITRVQIEIIGR